MMRIVIQAIFLFVVVGFTSAQYASDTEQYKQTLAAGVAELRAEIESHPDVNLLFFPERALITADSYVFDYPLSAEYRIGMLIDPCRYNAYNCCMNVYGSSEYHALLSSGLEQERVFKYVVLANETAVTSTYYLVYEDGSSIATTAQRSPDDNSVWNDSCVSDGTPYNYCQGRNYALQRSTIRPPCLDNNQSLDAAADCINADGTTSPRCMQVAFTSNAFIPQCGEQTDQSNCGTYLEIHMAHGSPYDDEETILSEAQVLQRNVSGYYSMTIPTTYKFNNSRLLCSYSESVLRVGSLVYVKSSGPVCCCPGPYTAESRVGSFQCPIGAGGLIGAYAVEPTTIADKLSADSLNLNYPFCHISTKNKQDLMMCSHRDYHDRKYFTRNCTTVTQADSKKTKSWTSRDMVGGTYDGVCPYYDSCALTLLDNCETKDLRFTFVGQVGLVTALDNDLAIPQVWLTFNGGRTSYQFSQQDVKLETTPKSMYEIWWVVRSHSEYTVQKRKGFNVTSPTCTFDITNNRYFPFAIVKGNTTLTSSPSP